MVVVVVAVRKEEIRISGRVGVRHSASIRVCERGRAVEVVLPRGREGDRHRHEESRERTNDGDANTRPNVVMSP